MPPLLRDAANDPLFILFWPKFAPLSTQKFKDSLRVEKENITTGNISFNKISKNFLCYVVISIYNRIELLSTKGKKSFWL